MNIKRLLCLVLCMTLCAPPLLSCAPAAGVPANTTGGKPSGSNPLSVDAAGAGYKFTSAEYTATRTGALPEAFAAATITAGATASGATASDAVPVDSVFTLTTSGATDAAEIARYVKLTPQVGFTVEKKSDTVYTLTPDEPLESGAVYRFAVGGEGVAAALSFAFQTETVFKLKSTLPTDLSTGVPVNTGIELRFNEPVGAESLSGQIAVEPAVVYSVKLYPDGKTAVLIPSDYLKENTVYTITVGGELAAASGRILGEGKTFKFRTEAKSSATAQGRVYFMPESYDLTFNTAQTPVYKWWTYTSDRQTITEGDAQVTIWRYASARALADAVKTMNSARADAYFSGVEYRYPTEGLEQVASYSVPVAAIDSSEYYRHNYLELRTGGRGFYLCEVTLTAASSSDTLTETYQAIVQVTDLCLYTEASGGSLLLWAQGANGLDASGTAVSAELFSAVDDERWNVEPAETVYTPASGKTDADGLCYINAGDAGFAYIIAEKGNDPLFRAASLFRQEAHKDYFCTLFTDREVYFANDTINFRGFARPTRGEKLPEFVWLTTDSESKTKIKVAEDGSFSGSYKLEDYYGWGVSLYFTDPDENYVYAKYVNVTQDEKPVYTAELSFDRAAYTYGEDAVVTLTASFFDGTPAPGLKFELNFNNFANGAVTVVTDAEGKATYKLKTGPFYTSSSYPVYLYCYAQLTGYEGTSLYLNADTLYFHSDVHFAYERVSDDKTDGKTDDYILLTLDNFDKTKIAALSKTKEDNNVYAPDYLKKLLAGPAQGSAHITLTESWYDEIQTGTVYDPINKTTSKTYRYEQRENILKDYTAEFIDGKLRLDYVDNNTDHWLYYTVIYNDAREDNNYSYTIGAKAGSGEYYNWYNPEYENYQLDYDDSPKSVGDVTAFTVSYGGEPVKSGRVLYTVYTDSRESAAVTAKNEYSLAYKADYIAGMQLFCVYFDGTSFVFTGGAGLGYNWAKNSSLALEVKPDRETYKPGETATVTVRVTDTVTGAPVTSGGVTLAVVDEACFALGEQSVNPADEFYSARRVIPYVCRNSAMSLFSMLASRGYYYAADATAEMPAAETGGMSGRENLSSVQTAAKDTAGGGGTGGAMIREIFADNPLFATLNAKSGVATFTFTVPDNITSWRLTAVAESETGSEPGGVKLGAAVSDAVCTLPFFVNAVVNRRYIAGDDVTASARVYGSALEAGTATSYTAEITGVDGKALDTIGTLTRTAPAGEQVFFSFGKLPSGSYNLTVTAAGGDYSDGVKLPFEVIESGVITPVYREIAPVKINALRPAAYPVTLTFYDSSFDNWMSITNRVLRSRGLRADTLAAYYAAGRATEKLFGGGEWMDSELEAARAKLAEYDNSTFVPLLPYDAPSAELTALICAVAPEALSAGRISRLPSAFYAWLGRGTDDDAEFAAMYLGLAALGEPVLSDLRYLAAHCGEMSLTAQLYICAALAYIGDFAYASALYTQIRALYGAAGEDGAMWFGKTDASAEERIAGAAAALLSASLIAREDADALAKYIMTRTSSLELYVLQLAAYVKAFIPADGKKLSVTYALADGEERTGEIGPFGRLYLTLDKRDFTAFKLISADEGVTARASYMGGLNEAIYDEKPTEEASITKKTEVYDAARGLYKVTLSYTVKTDRDWSYFTLTDLIPSGGRYFYAEPTSYYSGDDTYAYLYNDSGTMRGGVYVNTRVKSETALSGKQTRTVSGSVSYIFRTAIPGSYVAESAFMQNRSSGCWAQSERSSITLK